MLTVTPCVAPVEQSVSTTARGYRGQGCVVHKITPSPQRRRGGGGEEGSGWCRHGGLPVSIYRVSVEQSVRSAARGCRGLFVGCLMSQQQASVSQGRICSDNFTCCHTETEVADPTFYLTQSQYTDTGPTSPSADLITPGAWQGSHWSANFEVTGMTRPRKNPGASGIRTRDLPLSRRTPYH